MSTKKFDVGVIGSGLGSLTAAALLAKQGKRVVILEQNYLPGGCTSSYWRKGFIWESGATTVVGLDQNMPLKHLVDTLDIKIPVRKLDLPMKVYLNSGEVIHKHQNLEDWILEAEKNFGPSSQRKFWKLCYEISQFVWSTSLKQLSFPPSKFSDFGPLLKNISWDQLKYSRYSLITMEQLLKKYDLWENKKFVDYVNEQLLITAQNHASEVNVLFGATALCYTNYSNYYIDGGLLNLVNPIIDYIKDKGGEITLRNPVLEVKRSDKYLIQSRQGSFETDYLISGLPINDTVQIYQNGYQSKYEYKIMDSKKLNSAFQMGIGFRSDKKFDCVHHQIHLDKPLSGTGSKSIFVSLNHNEDHSRCDEPGTRVASISTHLPDPGNLIVSGEEIELEIIDALEQKGFLNREDIVYKHSSTQKSWQKWTGRAFGFVGGYPQFKNIKPWQMIDSRLDGHKAYICGDTTYPGQGIPGVVLSGIIAAEKLRNDWF